MSTEPDDPTPAASDESLMVAFSRGSTLAFNDLFLRHKQRLFGFFYRRIADRAQAEELTQEAFLALVRASSRYKPQARFRTYMYAIAFKILRAHQRKAALRATFFGTDSASREPARSDGEAELILREALGKLDRLNREILCLREFEQLDYAEIAKILKLPLNTVRSRLFRARIALRDLLAAPVTEPLSQQLTESEERI